MRGVLISIDAWSRAENARVTVRIGAGMNATTLGADGLQWEPALLRRPRLTQQLLDDDLTGSLMVGQGEFTLSAPLLRNLDTRQLEWVGAPVRIYTGDGSRLADLTREFVGRCTSGVEDPRTGQVPVQVEVDRAIVDVALLYQTYGGGGGADGDPEIRGTLKPAGYGRPINVKPPLIDQVNDVYQYEAYGNSTGCAGVYENLASFGAPLRDYPSYAALVAAKNGGAIPEGRWATCIAEGMFCLGATATGTITCDPICGAGTPGEMMLRWLRTHAGVVEARLRAADFAGLTAAVQAAVGGVPAVSYWTTDEGNVLELMQRMCASCNAVPLFMLDGTITVTRIIGGVDALTLDRQGGTPAVVDWATLDPTLPWWRMRMTAARTYNVHTAADIDYEDDIKDRGDYVPGETYRQGHVVRWTDGARYLFVNPTPAAGTPPPAAGFWELYEDAPDATQIKYPSGYTLADLEPAEKGATVGMTTAEEQAFALAQGSIAVILSDNVVAAGQEKAELKRRFDQAKAGYDTAHGTSVDFIPLYGDVTFNARVAVDAAYVAVVDYLNALRPAWDNLDVDTPVDGLQLTTRFANLWDKIGKLMKANDAFVRDRARQAQLDVNAIASDAVLSRGSEKAKALLEWDALHDDYDALVARFVALESPVDIAPSANQAAAAIGALDQYLDGLVPSWRDGNTDTPIVQSVWQQMWGNAYAGTATFRAAITGRRGPAGINAFTTYLTNADHTVPAKFDGAVTSYAGAESVFAIRLGAVDLTDSGQFDMSIAANPQNLTVATSGRYFRIDGGLDPTEDSATLTMRLTGNGQYAGVVIDQVFSLSKSKGGANGEPPPLIRLTASSMTLKAGTDGNYLGGQRIDFNAVRINLPGTTYFLLKNVDNSNIYAASAAEYAANFPALWGSDGPDNLYLTPQGAVDNMNAYGGAVGRFSITAYVNGYAVSDTVSIQKVQDGAKGANGKNAVNVIADNETFTVPTDAAGNYAAFPIDVSRGHVRVYDGATEVTAQCTFTIQNPFNLDGRIDAAGAYYAVGLYADTGYSDLIAVYNGVAYSARLTASKVKGGAKGTDGINPPLVSVSAAPQAISYDRADNLSSGPTTFTANLVNAIGPVAWSSAVGHGIYNTPGVTFSGNSMTLSPERMRDVLAYNLANFGKATETIIATASGQSDSVTVTKIRDGANGADSNVPGPPGNDGFSLIASPPAFVVPSFSNGTSKPAWTGGSCRIALIKGAQEVPADAYSYAAVSNIASIAMSGQSVTFADVIGDKGEFTARATRAGINYDLRVTVVRTKDGSSAFVSTGTISGDVSGTGGGNTTAPGGKTATISASATYGPPANGSAKGSMSFYWRNVTDNGPLQLLGTVEGSVTSNTNVGSQNDPEYETIYGSVSGSFSFTTPVPDKQIEYSVGVGPVYGRISGINGSVRFEVMS